MHNCHLYTNANEISNSDAVSSLSYVILSFETDKNSIKSWRKDI